MGRLTTRAVMMAMALAAAAAVVAAAALVFSQNASLRPDAGAAPRSAAEARPQTSGLAPPDIPPETFAPVFRPCAHCHEIGPGAHHKAGPHLNRLLGRLAGRIAGYPFSPALRDNGLIWDEAVLTRFLQAPAALVPGTRMIFSGLSDEDQIAALIAFLKKAGEAEPAPRGGRS